MKKSEPKPKPTNNHPIKPTRNGSAVAAEKEAPHAQPEKPRPAAADGSLPMPDLGQYGVKEPEARAHVAQCESCGRAHKHVVKNPKDVMALDAFGRHIAACIAVNQTKTPSAAAAAR
jgi:hypothetical protein